MVHEEFINSLMKSEHESVAILCPTDSKENENTVEEMIIQINPIKVEQNSGKMIQILKSQLLRICQSFIFKMLIKYCSCEKCNR